jgi:hypothetical protein
MYKEIPKINLNISILYLLYIIMNINELLYIAKEFFEIIHPNFCDDYIEENDELELWKLCEDFFQQIGQQF